MRKKVATLALLAVIAAGSGQAEEPPPFQEFTFKRVGVPKKGTAKRITVQIDPTLQVVKVAPKPEPKVATKESSEAVGTDWYWSVISPSLNAAGPGRFPQALAALGSAPQGQGVSSPRLQRLQEIAERHGTDLLSATIGTSISPALALALISVESGGRTDASSSAGASGLMQLMPDTATRFGVKDSTNPTQNIKGGVAYLDWLMKEFDSDVILALAGYNAGENAVKRFEGVPPYSETRAYVPKVLAAWQVARGLCLTPPELPSDGCVFAIQRKAKNG